MAVKAHPRLPPFPTHKGRKVQTVKRQKIAKPRYTIIVPIRNIRGPRVRNCLRSIKLQMFKGIELVVVDYGSNEESHAKLMQDLNQFDCTVYYCPNMENSKSTGINIGLRRARTSYVATMDVDCILETGLVEYVFGSNPRFLISVSPLFLPGKTDIQHISLPRDYGKLGTQKTRFRPPSLGAFMSAPLKWWHKVRGFDERMLGYGPEDRDLWYRAERDKEIKTLNLRLNRPKIKIFHQYHPRRPRGKGRLNRLIYESDKSLIRNNANWGIP